MHIHDHVSSFRITSKLFPNKLFAFVFHLESLPLHCQGSFKLSFILSFHLQVHIFFFKILSFLFIYFPLCFVFFSYLFTFLTFCTWFLCEEGISVRCYHAQIDLDVIITLELLLPCTFCKLTLLPSHPKIIVILHILHIDLVAFTLYNCALLGYFHLLMCCAFMHCAFVHCFLFLFYFSCFHCYFCCRASTHNSLFI